MNPSAFLEVVSNYLKNASVDHLSLGFINFKNFTYQKLEWIPNQDSKVFYDLASLTKPLTLSFYYFLDKKIYTQEMLWLLNHEAGLPSWKRLSKENWKQDILSYPIRKSSTVYSDLGAIRLMLELQKRYPENFFSHLKEFWDPEVLIWTDIQANLKTSFPEYGFRGQKIVKAVVHDDNAFTLGQFSAHAGLFASIDGLCQTLINFQKKFCFLQYLKENWNNQTDRFIYGFDKSTAKSGLAGEGHSGYCIGHLGFTGTSFWIDIEKSKGFVILSNATKSYWYDREKLNQLRRFIGEYFWKNIYE